MTISRVCASVLLAAGLAACGRVFLPPLVSPPAPIPAVAREVSGLILDAATGAPIEEQVEVTVLGVDGEPSPFAQDAAGHPTSSFVATRGIVAFQVDPGADLPLDLVIAARAQGYDAGSARIRVTGGGTFTFTARLASLGAPPEGVHAVVEVGGTADSGGVLSAPIEIQTPGDATTPTVRLQIPAGTTITTASGDPLTGQLHVTASYYAPTAEGALSAFPGGLDVVIGETEGSATRSTFRTAGFLGIEITDDDGNAAASFGTDFTLTLEIPDGTMSPNGFPIAVGDEIPFWSYDEATGRWRREGDLELTNEADGLFTGVFQVSHLTYFNLAWPSDSCETSQPLTITGNDADVALTLTLRSPTGGYLRSEYVTGSKSTPVTFKNAPSFPVDLEASLAGGTVGTLPGASLCGTEPLTLAVTLPAVSPAELEVSVLRACRQNPRQRIVVGSAAVLVRPANLLGTTGDDGTVEFQGLLAGAAVSVSARLLDGSAIDPVNVTLAAGANAVELVQQVECVLTGLTGGGGG